VRPALPAALIVAAVLFVYLCYALFQAERF